jgi:hypothetical protein
MPHHHLGHHVQDLPQQRLKEHLQLMLQLQIILQVSAVPSLYVMLVSKQVHDVHYQREHRHDQQLADIL